MKKLKALIKIELPPAVMTGIYFMLINFIAFAMIQIKITNLWDHYITYGISDFVQYSDVEGFSSEFSNTMMFTTIMYGIGLVFMVYFSFMKDKNHETGRFLKSLPYTMKERTLVKVIVGLCSYLINFIVLGTGMFILRVRVFHQFKEIYEVTTLGQIQSQIFTVSFMVKLMLFFLMICIAVYLYLILMQYMISPNLGSMISSILIFFAPIYVMISCQNYEIFSGVRWVDKILTFLVQMLFGPREAGYLQDAAHAGMDWYISSYEYIGSIGSYVIFWSIMILVLVVGLLKLSGSYSVEQSDIFIRNKVFRSIYIMGAALCGGLLFGDAYALFITRQTRMGAGIVFCIGLLISIIIANKIGHIGISKKQREVRA